MSACGQNDIKIKIDFPGRSFFSGKNADRQKKQGKKADREKTPFLAGKIKKSLKKSIYNFLFNFWARSTYKVKTPGL